MALDTETGRSEPESKAAAASAENRGDKKTDIRPTWDQIYLASRISDVAPCSSARLEIPAIQRLNVRYGVVRVTDALRLLRGHPPEIAVRSPYAYVAAICEEKA